MTGEATLRVRAALVRGGTSRALVFLRDALPADRAQWDIVFLAAIGSPDPRQLDGVGAGDSHTSKVAVLEPSSHPGADVDYLFGEVGILEPRVDYAGNSGNIIAGLALFAVEEGLVPGRDPETRVRVRNVNTDKVAHVTVPTPGGEPALDGTFRVDGVPGQGPRIDLVFPRPEGALTDALLPAGEPVSVLDVPGLGALEVTLVDAGNPAVLLRGDALGVRPDDAHGALNADRALLARIEALRAAASAAMGLVDDASQAARFSQMVPFPVLVFEPARCVALDGRTVAAGEMDLAVRVVSLGMFHKSVNVTMAVAVSAAAAVPGTVAAAALAAPTAGRLRIGHPSGVIETRTESGPADAGGSPVIESVALGRTARRILDAEVLVQAYKRRWLEGLAGPD